MKISIKKALGVRLRARGVFSARPTPRASRLEFGFTMVEIAICLAIIGIALVAIIGILPLGVNVQKDNREETLINQDATVLMDAIRGGARGADDLTNYVFAIVNTGLKTFSYTNSLAGPMNYASYSPPWSINYLTTGAHIVGLLSTPKYVDLNDAPLPSVGPGGYSNYIVAYVRSISGPASEKPPQDNSIVVGDSFSYKVICEIFPAVPTIPFFQAQSYGAGSQVFYNLFYWQATATTSPGDTPGTSPLWKQVFYPQQLVDNLYELRLTFQWPLLPNGNVGSKRQTFRTAVAGQIVWTNDYSVPGQMLYFFQPQSFTNNVSTP